MASTNQPRPSQRIDDDELSELLDRLADAPDEDARRELLDRLITVCMPVAQSLARRYRNRGISEDDLEQVAYVGLTKAAHRYDASSAGDHFLSFAVPTIRGELRRHFRDHGWMVRPTRSLQELQPQVIRAREELHEDLGRSPRPSEIAAHLGESEGSVVETLMLDGCFRPTALDIPAGENGGDTLATLLPSDESGWGQVEARVVLKAALDGLGERDRRILFLRFFEERTQREIAIELGVTQMQISRLLARIFSNLRDRVGQLTA